MTNVSLFKTKFIKNLSYAFAAQGISLCVSLILNFLLPKFLGVADFSFWQLFIFYSQYLPFLALGLNDGVYLRYGGISFSKLNFSSIKSQLFVGLFYQVILSLCFIAVSYNFLIHDNRLLVIIFSCIYFLFFTVQNFLGYVFQAANETSIFSKATLCQRLAFVILMFVCIVFRVDSFLPFVISYTIAEVISLVYSIYHGKSIFLSKFDPLSLSVRETGNSIKVGSKLMFANIASMLILGIGRQAIDIKWGLITFGKVSLSITLTNFVLVFIQQIGLVMFPMLRQVKDTQRRHIYILCRNILSILLPIIYLLYFPGAIILKFWLPQYSDSIRYLILLLPICLFDAKNQILCNTYFKVRREERILLKINIASMLLSLILCSLGVFIFNSVFFVILSMTISLFARNVISEIYLSKKMDISFFNDVVIDFMSTVLFIASSLILTYVQAFFINLVIYMLTVYWRRKRIIDIIKYLNKK